MVCFNQVGMYRYDLNELVSFTMIRFPLLLTIRGVAKTVQSASTFSDILAELVYCVAISRSNNKNYHPTLHAVSI